MRPVLTARRCLRCGFQIKGKSPLSACKTRQLSLLLQPILDEQERTMTTPRVDNPSLWAANWLSLVVDGTLTMSQRKLSSIETRGGGLEAVTAAARARGVHLAVLVDDRGQELVTASTHPIRVLC